jgi:hypothetical protein
VFTIEDALREWFRESAKQVMESSMMRGDDSMFGFLNALNGLSFQDVSARLAVALMRPGSGTA